jgi:hypothetical protein
VAESIPTFGAILSLVGGSTATLLAYICPSLFYLKLRSVRQEDMIVNREDVALQAEEKYIHNLK